MNGLADILASSLSLVLLARIAWIDFRTLRIANRDVLVLTAVAAVLLIPGVTPEGWANLVPAFVLFALGVLFWLLRAMGAGDAKLFFPLGILIGFPGLVIFALGLLPFSLVFLLLTRLAKRGLTGQGAVSLRLAEIAAGRGIPYGVPMALAAALAILFRLTA